MIERIIPKQANNNYLGSPLAFYGMILFVLLMIFSAYMHFLQPQYAANKIANIIVFESTPDPNQIIYMAFSLWGLQQTSFVIFNVIVLFSYRNLIPLMYLLWIFTWLMRPLVVGQLYPLTPEYTTGITPGIAGLPVILSYLLIMLLMSLRQPKDKAL
jgi:hypothetical protein